MASGGRFKRIVETERTKIEYVQMDGLVTYPLTIIICLIRLPIVNLRPRPYIAKATYLVQRRTNRREPDYPYILCRHNVCLRLRNDYSDIT